MIAIATIAQNRVDWFIIEFYYDVNVLADYTISRRLYEYLLFAITVPITIILPWLYANETGYIERIKKIILPVITLSLLVHFAIFYGFPTFEKLIWQGKYEGVHGYLSILSIVAIHSQCVAFLYHVVISLNKEKLLLRSVIFITLIQIILNTVAISTIGVYGAIWTTFIVNLLTHLYYSYYLGVYSSDYGKALQHTHTLVLTICGILLASVHFQQNPEVSILLQLVSLMLLVIFTLLSLIPNTGIALIPNWSKK